LPNVFEDFTRIFKPRIQVVPPIEEDSSAEDSAARAETVRDMRTFVSTQAYKDYRSWLDREIEQTSPDPAMGSDVASCYTFKREGLIVSRRRLDTMVRLAEEKIANG